MRALITGATGLIGRTLIRQLQAPVILTRDPNRTRDKLGSVDARFWDPMAGAPPLDALRQVDAIFHLAGEPIANRRWSEAKKRAIRDSRVRGTRNLIAGLAQLERKPEVLVSASAVGIYGDRGDEELYETSEPGSGFLAEVCAAWEKEAMAASPLGMRVVCVRTGIVLAPHGGALARMLTPFRLGAGGRLGTGRQWMSWIHIEDLVGLLLHASNNAGIRGPLNGVSPYPVTNADFTKTLGRSLHRPTLFPLPKTALRMALGQMSEILLHSQRVYPREAIASGYVFKYPNLQDALASLVQQQASKQAA